MGLKFPWLSDKQEAVVLKLGGVNPGLKLTEACADFYILEALSHEDREASRMLDAVERSLSREFSNYLTLAVGGELKYYPRYSRENGCGCEDYEFEECEHVSSGEDCPPDCPGEYEVPVVCDHRPETVSGVLQEAFFSVIAADKDSRAVAWEAWHTVVRTVGVEAHRMAADIFDMDEVWGGWSAGFGGRKWGVIARVVYDFQRGAIKPRLFVDRCWTLEHNGGCVFNKMYRNLDKLRAVLDLQAKDETYDRLVSYTSPTVRRLKYRLDSKRYEEHDPGWLGVQRPELY